MTKNPLSVRCIFDLFHPEYTRIIKLAAPDCVTPLCAEDSKDSPKTAIIAIRRLHLPRGIITPVHCHPSAKREKLYIHEQIGGVVVVYIYSSNQWNEYYLHPNIRQPVVIPPGTFHSIFCPHGADILVVFSNQDTNDILWEDGAEELLEKQA